MRYQNWCTLHKKARVLRKSGPRISALDLCVWTLHQVYQQKEGVGVKWLYCVYFYTHVFCDDIAAFGSNGGNSLWNILMCKLLERNEFWHFIFFYLTNVIWKKSCTVYSLVFMIARFLKRIELDIQSGFAYPPLPLSLRHRKCIFKPPFDVLFTGLSWSWTAGKLCKWCKSNIRECNSFLSTSALNLFACSRVQSVLKNNLWY